MNKLNKKIALITGASKGLGAFSAKRFWNEGYTLCLVSRDLNNLSSFASTFEKRENQEIYYFPCNLGNKEDIEKLIVFIKENFFYLNVLINNAAIQGPIGPLLNNDMDLWEETLKVNFFAPVYLCRAFIPLMSNLECASIINLSGGGATSSRPNFTAYSSSKVALVRFSEILADELKEKNIRVNCAAPGAMNTDMLSEVLKSGEVNSGQKEYIAADKVFKNGGASMEKIADLLIFLSSEKSKYITGKLISALWDNWENWPNYVDYLNSSDSYTLRRITGKDRGFDWGDK